MPESPKFLMEVKKLITKNKTKKEEISEISLKYIDPKNEVNRFASRAKKFVFLQAGREREAVHVFRQMFRLNMLGKGESLPVSRRRCAKAVAFPIFR